MQKSPGWSTVGGSGKPGSVAGRRWPAAGLLAGLVLVLALLALAGGALPTGSQHAADPCTSSRCVALGDPADRSMVDATPSPTLGSTESPNPNPPGDNDGDADDFSGAIWILPAVFILFGIAGGVYFLRTRNRNRNR